MSGIEVAGLVFAAWPLVVGALRLLEKLPTRGSNKRDCDDSQLSLEVEMIRFESTLRGLLPSLGGELPGANMAINTFLADIGDQSPHMTALLKKKLPDHRYRVFEDTMSQLLAAMLGLMVHLGVQNKDFDKEQQALYKDHPGLKAKVQPKLHHLKVLFGRNLRRKLVSEIKEYNHNLQVIARANDVIEIASASTKPKSTLGVSDLANGF